MANKEFINELTNDLQPVKPLASPMKRYAIWLIFSLISVGLALLVLRPYRPDFISSLSSLGFLAETLMAFLPALLCGYVAIQLSHPGVKVTRAHYFVAALPFVLFLGFLAYGYFFEPSLAPSMAGKRPHCFTETLVLSWIPICAMVYLIRGGYALNNMALSLTVALSGSTIPMAYMQVACMYDPLHVFRLHVTPTLIVIILMLVFGKKFLKPKY